MIKHWLKLTALAGLVATCQLSMAADLSGNWVAQIATQYTRVSLKDDGGKLSGMWGELKLAGTVTGDKIDITLSDAQDKPSGSLTGTDR